MSPRLRADEGIALLIAIFVMVVISALLSAAFFVGLQETRVGRGTIRLQQAMAAAEEGVARRIAEWNPIVTNQIPLGDSMLFAGSVAGGAGWYRGYVLRLDSVLYLVVSEGFSPDSASQQRVGILARLQPIEIDLEAAFETQGVTDMSEDATVSGIDTTPPGWSGCPVPTDTVAGVRTNDRTQFRLGVAATIEGDPPVEEDADISDSSLATFGGLRLGDLRKLATLVLSGGDFVNRIRPSASGGVCSVSDTGNWGEPGGPGGSEVTACYGHFPVVFVDGDAALGGLRGQGVLVVNGDLAIKGGFDFRGLVIVRGTLTVIAGPARILGSVIAANTDGGDNRLADGATIRFSSCALRRAITNGAVGWPLLERAWLNLY